MYERFRQRDLLHRLVCVQTARIAQRANYCGSFTIFQIYLFMSCIIHSNFAKMPKKLYRTGRMASTRRERIMSTTTLSACQYNFSSLGDVAHCAYSLCVHVHALNLPIVKQYTSKESVVIVPQESIIIRISPYSSTSSIHHHDIAP